MGERMEMLNRCLDRGELETLERYSPEELYLAMLSRGQSDPELVRYIRISQELGSVWLHPGVGGATESEDMEFLHETLQCVFPELAEDGKGP